MFWLYQISLKLNHIGLMSYATSLMLLKACSLRTLSRWVRCCRHQLPLTLNFCRQPSFVVAYVPSWLKFSYLSELLVRSYSSRWRAIPKYYDTALQEASIADISYLFEEGALVDFEIDELVKLVKALFADTPLRSHTVAKLLRGHPTAQGTNAPR